MGTVNADVVIRNPADRSRSWEGRFLVDTGATDSLVPRPHLEAIGLTPEAQRTYVLADGTEITLDVAVARIELMGEIVGGTVLFGDADAEPLLGVTALESLGIEVDPLNQRLKKLPAVRLKNLSDRVQESRPTRTMTTRDMPATEATARPLDTPTARDGSVAAGLTQDDAESTSTNLTHKSLQAALAAIEIYNKPCFSYREESFAILMANAWELALKAKWVFDHGDDETALHIADKKTGSFKKNRSGNPLTLDLISLSKKLLNNKNSGLGLGCLNNILALLEIRDNAVHFLHRDLHLNQRVLEVGVASLQNYAQLIQRWFALDLSDYNMFLMPISFHHGFDTAQAIAGVRRSEQVRNLLEYISNLERDQPPNDTQRVTIYLETKLVRQKSESAIEFNWTDDPKAPAMAVREEDVLKTYSMTYKSLTKRLRGRYSDFVENKTYHRLRKKLETDKRYCITRFLNPGNSRSSRQRFYSPNILPEFDKHYLRKSQPAGPHAGTH